MVPLTARDKKNTEGPFVQWCRDANISLLDFTRWCVEKWDDLSSGEMKWAKLDPLPTYGRIYALKDKLLPHCLKARGSQRAEEPRHISMKDREEQRRKTVHFYKMAWEIPARHPLYDILKEQVDKGIPIIANHYKWKPLCDVPESKHAALEAERKDRIRQRAQRKYPDIKTFYPDSPVPDDHPFRDSLLQYLRNNIPAAASWSTCTRLEDYRQ